VLLLIWIMQRIIGKRLSEIQTELGELHVEVSRLFVLTLNANPKADASKAEPNIASAECVTVGLMRRRRWRSGALRDSDHIEHHASQHIWLIGSNGRPAGAYLCERWEIND
jgi:hypothetical protein